ncbi:MAG: ABC transporter substrate-binding protein [Phyllobacterium sp.]
MITTRRTFVAGMLTAPIVLRTRSAFSQTTGTVFRLAISETLSQLDPHKATIASEYIYNNLVFNGLVRMNEDLKTEPDLASSWSLNDDLTVWTFQLRKGVKFHNGREMKSADVVATIKRIQDPATTSRSRTNMQIVTDVKALDDYTVEFKLASPYSSFAELLTDRQIKIVPQESFDQLSKAPVGTGAFVFASYVPGDRLILKRNDAYFEEGLPKLFGVEMRAIREPSVQIAALRSGEIDAIFDLLPESITELKSETQLRVETVATGTWDGAILNNATSPFSDVRVRQALHLAVDKRDVIELSLFGLGSPTHSPIPSSHAFFASDIGFSKADPEAARSLLREAGHPNGISIPIVVRSDAPAYQRLAVTLQQLAQPGGFNFSVQQVPYARFSADFAAKAPIVIDGYFSRPSVDTSTYPFFHSKGLSNSYAWLYNNPKVDEILTNARSEADMAKQKDLYIAFQKELHENPAGFIAYNKNFSCAYRSAVQGVRTHPMQWFDLRKVSIEG